MPVMVVRADGRQRETLTTEDLIRKLQLIQSKLKNKNTPVLIRFESISGWRVTSLDLQEEDDEVPKCALIYMEE